MQPAMIGLNCRISFPAVVVVVVVYVRVRDVIVTLRGFQGNDRPAAAAVRALPGGPIKKLNDAKAFVFVIIKERFRQRR